jgi:class 3 adenylate cyclase
MRGLSERFTLIRYDPRGTGLSGKDAADLSAEGTLKDLEAVVEATQARKFVLFSMGGGSMRAIMYAALYPEKIDRLILLNGWARTLDLQSREALELLAQLALVNWELATEAITARADDPTRAAAWSRMYLQSTTGDIASRYILATIGDDATAYLARIAVPTLVMQETHNSRVPMEIAQGLAASIKDATLIYVTAERVADWGPEILGHVDSFVGIGAPPSGGPSASLRTVLFTDLVGHTEMMSRLGDERGRAVLREHERITREVLAAHGGTEVKTMGDGFMASFGSVTKAVECAVALQTAIDERNRGVGAQQPRGDDPGSERRREVAAPLQVRIGLNAGEPIEEEGDLFGATVILASRIAAKAGGGEILVSDNVRSLSAGKGILFADRGEFVAKGFEEPVRVYEVNWRAQSE